MRKTLTYPDRQAMRAGKQLEHTNGFRSEQTNFINNEFIVVFDNSPEIIAPRPTMTQPNFIKFLAEQQGIDLI